MSDNSDHRVSLGKRLRNAREYLGLSQEDAAKVMGLTRTAITKVENGTRRVDTIELSNFADLYQQPVAALSGKSESEPLPSNVQALARTASELSNKDREALLKFAYFLQGKPPEAD